MHRLLFAAISLWAFLVGPGLCLAGVVEHLCVDCPEKEACGHEEDCYSDPCGDFPLPPDSPNSTFAPASAASLVDRPDCPPLVDPDPARLALDGGPSLRTNLPLPKDALPLIA
jgi:hypothetical protein